MDVNSVLFFVLSFILLIALIIIIIRVGISRLESAIGIMGDGIPVGNVTPNWNLPDIYGITQHTPSSSSQWQFLIFCDYGLAAFPSVIEGIRTLSQEKDLQVLLITIASLDVCRAMARGLRLTIPVVSVDDDFYQQFRVRVMPFGYLVDSSGVVQWKGLVNESEQMNYIWYLANQVIHQNETARG